MKRTIWTRIIAFVLIFSLLPVNVSAASFGSSSRNSKWGWNWEWLWDLLPGIGDKDPVETEPEEPTVPTDPAEDSNTELVLIEDETTVENGEMLRASTYVLSNADSAPANNTGIALMSTRSATTAAEETTGTVLKYFGVTMYDYDTDTINAATDSKDSDLTVREGLYFSTGAPEFTTTTTTDLSSIVAGQYYIQNIRADANGVGSWLAVSSSNYIISVTDQSEATLWTLEITDGNYYLKDSNNYYLSIGNGTGNTYVRSTQSAVELSGFGGNSEGLQISNNGYYLCQWGGVTATSYGGYNVNNDPGNGMRFYRVEGEDQILTTVASETIVASGYALWNRWDKGSGGVAAGQKTWTGLVASELDANKDIVFNVPDGGIFNSDATVKSIYTNVQMPFVYENGVYTFDAATHGVYFHEDEGQGSSGTAGSNTRLYFNEGTPQDATNASGNWGDGSTTVWAPFNDKEIFTENEQNLSSMNYHFGVRTTIPFTMTTNGRMNENNEESDAITFSFSGDDDVWVFIDGKLVIDLGGIHNRLDATIDFAANTVTYSASNSKKDEYATGSYNDESFQLEQQLFGNLISQDRATFAAADSHELTIFYLERGKGSSNCKIEFNLPMKDTVTVTKHATQSWTEDGTEEGQVTNLTAREQAIVNNIDFGFTLYKSTDGTNFSPVSNTNFRLMNENGQVLEIRSTDANGHFYLRNGQSARFVTTFIEEGVTYYVVEDNVSSLGFVTPDFNFDGAAADGFVANGVAYTSGNKIPEQVLALDASANQSYSVTVYGSDESEDSLVFICENYIDAKLPNPSALPADDRIVIDYGLDVIINVLGNDNYRGDTVEIMGVFGSDVELLDAAKATSFEDLEISQIINNPNSKPAFGTASVNSDKTLKYVLNQQLTGVEELKYLIKVTGSTTNTAGTTTTAYSYGIGTVYVIPATTMYYEENFASMITYTGKFWGEASAYTSVTQEPGVVGTVGDSPYGSDAAYLNNSTDSIGTSRYAETKNSAVKFSYTFTGTGTSFFARTSNNSGFMKIVITEGSDGTGEQVHSSYRDTYYKTEDDSEILYNIPVFTYHAAAHGTYTVTVTVYKGTTANGYGTDFWLDGVRVYQPLDPALLYPGEGVTQPELYKIAASAYATDGEANMANVTLRDKILTEADLMVDENGDLVLDDLGNPIPVWTENGKFVLFTDSNGNMQTAEEYESFGPKEEVYLNNGQSVTFSLYDWDPNSNRIYLGIKAPKGNGTVTIGTTQLTISNSVDCYYDISSYGTITTDEDGIKTITFTITAGSGSLISLTNIKVSGNFEFTIITETDIETDNEEEADPDEYIDPAQEEAPAEEDTNEDAGSEEPAEEPAEAPEDTTQEE